MAKADIGPKIGIDGEAEFRRQIQDLNTGLKTLSTEMDVVTSSYADNERSVEALTAKNDVLDRKILTLNEKLEKQQEMLKKCADAYGEADKRTQYMQQQVNKTTTEINKATNAYNANAKQLEKLGAAGEGVGGILKSAFGSISESLTGKLGSALGLSTDQMKSLTSAVTSGSGAMGGLSASSIAAASAVAAVGVAAVKVGAELVKLSEEAGKNADAVNTMATKYSMSTADIQKLQYMAELTDTSVETITGSITKLTRSMDAARDGTGDAAEAFDRLGVKVTRNDGSLRDANDVFYQTLDALAGIGNQTERDSLAMDIFGKSAMELNTLIAAGPEAMQAYAQEAENLGYVMSEKMLTSLQAVDDATVRLNNSKTALANTLGAIVAPAVSSVTNWLATYFGLVTEGLQEMFNLDDSEQGLANTTKELGAAASDMSKKFNEQATAMNNAETASRSLKTGYDELKSAWSDLESQGYGRVLSYYDSKTGHLYQTFASQEQVSAYRSGTDFYDIWNQNLSSANQKNQITINLDGYTVGKAVTPRVNGQNYTTGNVL